jgi:hypothetical protein
MEVIIRILFFWVVTPCSVVGGCRNFGEETASIFRAVGY